jgi:N-methylhydantoinase B
VPGLNRWNGAALPAKVTRSLEPGDVIRIETPGGGGFGDMAETDI